MDLHQIKYFLAVVDHNGINAAAAVLDVAQPTISQAVQGLERELGVQLFHRIGRGMVLTSAGHSLVGPARRILRDVVAAEGSLVDAAGRPRGRLDIFAMSALSADPVARLVGAFRREFPKAAIRIGDLRDEAMAASLIKEGHCEIVVCHLPATDQAGLDVCELGVQEYWLVLPPGSAAPPDDPLPLAELPDISHVTVPQGSSLAVGEIEQAVTAAGRAIHPSVVVEHREARLPFVLAGVGATFLERSMAEAAAARGAVVRSLEPRISRAYGLVYDSAALSPAGRAFVDLARANGCP
ncbi:LysR family transcriptional regulator [Actinomadura rudentiformis]|uniref:LysR family transcriptional regulator n=1 Tax=Actinomadura rudentiformis TaxID=359158 RepID=A0A6H9YRT9_9ACTN|nr:LysR family transcriptional regulator [Actinomadura rudentiformis]KAB2344473.1 LysR family transcriptional regulator [Actinomadura rudentiformis]